MTPGEDSKAVETGMGEDPVLKEEDVERCISKPRPARVSVYPRKEKGPGRILAFGHQREHSPARVVAEREASCSGRCNFCGCQLLLVTLLWRPWETNAVGCDHC